MPFSKRRLEWLECPVLFKLILIEELFALFENIEEIEFLVDELSFKNISGDTTGGRDWCNLKKKNNY